MTSTPPAIRIGSHVRPLDRSGIWIVDEIKAGRAKCHPIDDVWSRKPRWFSLDDLVPSREEA